MKKNLILFVMFCSLSMVAQNIITGTVTDIATNEVLAGVSIVVKNTTNGTATDMDGVFTIKAKADDVLVFSYVGYSNHEEAINNQSTLNIALKTDSEILDEVILVGYGTQKKSDLTGAVAVAEMDEINKLSVATIDQALQGQIAGVNVTSNSGTPGGGVTVNVRGVGSIHGSPPLFVVDGMMVSDIDFLSPSDIKSIQVLKDASSSAIYGSRGSNGVVIIATKGGNKNRDAKVSFNSHYGFQNFWRSTNVLDATTWGTLRNEAMVAAGNVAPIADPSSLQNTIWFDEVSNRNAPISSTDVSISGGGEKSSYFMSANYFNQEGIVKKTGFDRVTLKVNSSYQAKPWLKVGENLALIRNNYQSIAEQDEWTGAIITSISADPASPVRNPDGTFARGIYNDSWNPAAILEYTNNKDVVYRTIGNVFANIELVKDLVFKTSYSLEYSFGETDDYDPVYFVSPVQQNAVSNLSKNNSSRFTGQWTNTLNYKKLFNEHSIAALLGVEHLTFDYKYNGISVNNVPSDDIDIRFIDNATGNNAATVWGSQEQVRQLSYLSRINYSYKDRYLLTANFRADSSSKFTTNNQWGYFPSFSVGWKISEEDFLQTIGNIDFLKIRAGWGQLGNQGVLAPYGTTTNASSGTNYLWGGILAPGSSFPSSGNDELKWETITTSNFGLDYGFFGRKLSGSLDYFIKNTTDMLLRSPVPGQTGIQDPPWQNAGAMKNTGFELAIQYKNKAHDFKYSFGGVFSKTINEVTDLGGKDEFIADASFFNSYFVTRTSEGRPIAQFYGFKTDGLFQNQAEIDAQTAQTNVAPGDVKYVDVDNDGELDFFYLGSPLPDFTFGFNTNFEYKNFDLSVQLNGVYGNKIFNGTSQYKRSSTANWNLGSDMVNRWTGEGTQNDSRYPRMNANDVNNSRMSDRFIEDGSYLRIKTVQFGYNVPVADKMKLDKLRIYVNAQNLFTFTNYSGLDPEIGVNSYNALDRGVDRGYYPSARMYGFGVKIEF